MANSGLACTNHVLRLVALQTPAVVRHCVHCGGSRPFVSRDRFRVNANRRRIDVWLIYGCSTCGETWKRPIHERCPVERLGPATYEAFASNDRALARRIAFDTPGLRQHGLEVDADVDYMIDGELPETCGNQPIAATLCLDDPIEVRLDRLLCRVLGLSRSGLSGKLRDGTLRLAGNPVRALRRSAAHGQRFELFESTTIGTPSPPTSAQGR